MITKVEKSQQRHDCRLKEGSANSQMTNFFSFFPSGLQHFVMQFCLLMLTLIVYSLFLVVASLCSLHWFIIYGIVFEKVCFWHEQLKNKFDKGHYRYVYIYVNLHFCYIFSLLNGFHSPFGLMGNPENQTYSAFFIMFLIYVHINNRANPHPDLINK